MQGDDVALLHQELSLLGYNISAQEIQQKLFAQTTTEAVSDFQSQHNLQVTGKVDESTAKAINEAVDALKFTVTVSVRSQEGNLLSKIAVKAFDKDLRTEELLGEAVTNEKGSCTITYTAAQFTRAEKKSADLFVRAFTSKGTLLGESDVIFNARCSESITLTVEIPEEPKLSEYEQLQAALAPVLQNLTPADLTEDDISFLLKELVTEDIVSERLLRLLVQSAQLAQTTELPAEFFYGLARQLNLELPLKLEMFVGFDVPAVRKHLIQAIQALIIPVKLRDSLDSIIARFEQLKLDHGAFIQRQIKGELVNQDTQERLDGYRVRATYQRSDGETKELGYDISNKQGQFFFVIVTMPAEEGANLPLDKLQLNISKTQGEVIYQTEIDIPADLAEVLTIPVPAHVLPQPKVQPIEEVTQAIELELPETLQSYLAEREIHTLEDIRSAGGVARLENLPVPIDDITVTALDAHANLTVLSSDIQTNSTLIEKGYSHIATIANTPRARFLKTTEDALDRVEAECLWVKAKAQCRLLNNLLTGIGVDHVSGISYRMGDFGLDQDEVIEGRDESGAKKEKEEILKNSPAFKQCQCRDCEAAVSPLAYLADLLNYAVEHIENDGNPVSLQFLTETFHQPFGDLPVPASCEAIHEKVRQVRLCVEVLRSYLGTRPLGGGAGSRREEALQKAEKNYCHEAYTTLLTKLGITYAELRQARSADAEMRQSLADRLGIGNPDRLEELFLEPVSTSEQALEELFGLINTNRDPLSDGRTRNDSHQQIVRWQLDGIEWGWNTDSEGIIYVELTHPSPSTYLVELYRDRSRTPDTLVASGEIHSSRGTINLTKKNRSNLSGSIEIDYKRDTDTIALDAIPKLLCWRFESLRSLWLNQDRPADPYANEAIVPYEVEDLLPIIDPDLIGPDDFRIPFAKLSDTEPDKPFDLWFKRRRWVDRQIQELDQLRGDDTLSSDEERLIALLGRMYEPISYESVLDVIPWADTIPIGDFSTLSENLEHGKDIEETKELIQSSLRLTVERFTLIRELQKKVQGDEELQPEDWEELCSILIQAQKITLFPQWRDEERDMKGGINQEIFSPRFFWMSLREPKEGAWPPAIPDDRPFIDPDLVKLEDLPEPTVGRRTIAIWHQRRERLNEIHNRLKTTHESGGTEGFNALFNAALGIDRDWQTYLDELSERLRIAEATEEEGSPVWVELEADLAEIHLTQKHFKRLMEIQSKESASEAEWDEVYGILTTAYKEDQGLPAGWRREENEDQMINGKYWNARKAKLPKWRAAAIDRYVWRQSLEQRSSKPIIDPDLIHKGYLRSVGSGSDSELWIERHDWMHLQIKALQKTSRDLAGFDAILVDSLFGSSTVAILKSASIALLKPLYHGIPGTSDVDLDDLISVAWSISFSDLKAILSDLDDADIEEARIALETVTQVLGLTVEAFRRLMAIIEGSITPAENVEVSEILVPASLVSSVIHLLELRKKGENILPRLSQLGLNINAFSQLIRIRNLLAIEQTVLPSEWEDVFNILLQVRKQREFADWHRQEQDADIILSQDFFQLPPAPPLQFPPPEPEPLLAWRATKRDQRDWKNILESRIGQVETTAAALGEVVSNTEEVTLPLLRNALIIAADGGGSDLANKAKRLADLLEIDTQAGGCKQTTRISQAIVTVQGILWSLRTGQLQDTYEDLDIEAESFDEEWQWIGSYSSWRAAMFVFLYPENLLFPNLRTSKTPAFQTMVQDIGRNNRLTPDDARKAAFRYSDYLRDIGHLNMEAAVQAEAAYLDGRSVVFIFASSDLTDTIYFSWYDPAESTSYPQSFWKPLTKFENVTKVVGATVYKGSIFFFGFVDNNLGERRIAYITLDLTNGDWGDVTDLELPQKRVGSIVLEQNTYSDRPCITIKYAYVIYYRKINIEGKGWDDTEWQIRTFMPYSRFSLSTMIEVSSRYKPCLISLDKSRGRILYRFLGDKDDGRWREVEIGRDRKVRIFCWPRTRCIYIFSSSDTSTIYHKLQESHDPLGKSTITDISEFHNWCYEISHLSIISKLNSHVFKHESQEHSTTLWVVLYLGSDDEDLKDLARSEIESFVTDLLEDEKWAFFEQEIRAFTVNGIGLAEVLNHYLDGHSVDVKTRTGDIIEQLGRSDYVQLLYVAGSTGYAVGKIKGLRRGTYFTVLTREDDDRLTESSLIRIAPTLIGPSYITENLSEIDSLIKRRTSTNVFNMLNPGAPASVLAYLEEAYYFVPIYLALQLKRQGHYISALDWFRNVYDYRQPINQRKISYVLEREESFSEDYERFAGWLLDPLNPHEIAVGRTETYTRFTLLSLVRCLLDYADAEFTLDTAESVPRARTLYTTALELLDCEPLKQPEDRCAEILGDLTIEIEAAIEASAPELMPHRDAIMRELGHIADEEALTGAVDSVRVVLRSDRPLYERLRQASDIVSEVQPSPPKTLAILALEQQKRLPESYSFILAQPTVAEAAETVGLAIGDRIQSIDKIPSGINTADEKEIEFYEANFGSEVEEDVTGPEVPIEMGGMDPYQPSLSYNFCIPRNPILQALRLRAELNLYKIRTCRNITGIERQIEPYAAPTDSFSGLPQIGADGQIVLPGAIKLQATPYRYSVLIGRAKELAQLAAQFEGAMLSALEKLDAEQFNLLKAHQDVQLARQGVKLQELRVREAEDGITLAELQQERAQIQVETYQEWLDAGLNVHEQAMKDNYKAARFYRMIATGLGGAARAIQTYYNLMPLEVSGLASTIAAAIGAEALFNVLAIYSEIQVQIDAIQASHERRKDEWELQKSIAEQDVRISDQQIVLANDRVRVVGQERKIAQVQTDHAEEIVEFLANKFGNAELYDWMSGVLADVYSFFLHQATATAKLAESQIAFERQEIPPACIQSDYWEPPSSMELSEGSGGDGPDRRGLTGSARLLQDIYQLDQYAFETDRRKQQLTKTISLAQLDPFAYTQFRQTGVLTFATPMELFDRDFPGHYLRLIKRVRTSVIALIPPTAGIHATLSTTGLSKVVIGNEGLFQRINVIRQPESVALTSPVNATGLFEMTPQTSEMLMPFEGIGVEVSWEFRLPKPSNQFDYSTIADVLITIEYTALADFTYRTQVISELDTTVSAERSFSFRNQFADQWYDLNNPELTDTPMVVRFDTREADFPPNINNLKIQQVLLYFVRAEGVEIEIPVTYLRFMEDGGVGVVGGEATTSEGVISTRRGNAGSWISMLGKSPYGTWELSLNNNVSDGRTVQELLKNEEITDILFVITYSGNTPEWPE